MLKNNISATVIAVKDMKYDFIKDDGIEVCDYNVYDYGVANLGLFVEGTDMDETLLIRTIIQRALDFITKNNYGKEFLEQHSFRVYCNMYDSNGECIDIGYLRPFLSNTLLLTVKFRKNEGTYTICNLDFKYSTVFSHILNKVFNKSMSETEFNVKKKFIAMQLSLDGLY